MNWDQSAVYVRDIWGIVEDDASLDAGAAGAGAVSYIARPARSGRFCGAVSREVVGSWDFSGQHGDSMGGDSEDNQGNRFRGYETTYTEVPREKRVLRMGLGWFGHDYTGTDWMGTWRAPRPVNITRMGRRRPLDAS